MTALTREFVLEWKQELNFIQPERTQSMEVLQQLKLSYLQQVNDELQRILDESPDETLRPALITFLKTQWQLIQGSALCYTSSINKHTPLFLKLAERLCISFSEEPMAEANRPKSPSPLELMMPEVNLESISDDFFDWSSAPAPQEFSLDEKREFARMAWFKKTGCFDESHCLSLEEVPELKALSRKKERNVEEEQKFNELSSKETMTNHRNLYLAFQIRCEKKARMDAWIASGRLTKVAEHIIPTLRAITTSFFTQYILDDTHQNIIPIAMLLNEDHLMNPYSGKPLSETERYRLHEHSDTTKALSEARKQRDKLMNDDSHLLGHLNRLRSQLRANDADRGVGKQTDAGSWAYPAILAFNDYYITLNESVLKKIPVKVKQEIERLLSLSSDKELNHDATSQLETCIATRGSALEAAMLNQEGVLSTIASTQENMAKQIDAAKEEVALREKSLQTALEKNTYEGTLSLPVTQKLLDYCKANFPITSMDLLRSLLLLSPNECELVASNQASRIVNLFPAVEDLVIFLTDIPLPALNNLLNITAPKLTTKFAGTVNGSCQLLSALNGDKFDTVFRAILQEQIESLDIHNRSKMISSMLEYFKDEPEKIKKILLQQAKPELAKLLSNASNLGKSIFYIMVGYPKSLKVILALFPEADRITVVKELNQDGHSALHLAANHNLESLGVILALFPEADRLAVMKEPNKDGHSALHLAANHNHESLRVILALFPEADRLTVVKEPNKYGYSALHLAAMKNHESLKVILALFSEDVCLAAVKEPNKYGYSALRFAANHNLESFSVILALFPEADRLAVVKELNQDSHSDLHLEANHNLESFSVILALLPEADRLAVLNKQAKHGAPVFCITELSPKLLKVILKVLSEADRLTLVRKQFIHYYSAYYTVASFKPESLKVILELLSETARWALLKEQDKGGDSILHYATKARPQSLKVILELFPEAARRTLVQDQNNDSNSVLRIAANHNPISLSVIWALLPENDRLDVIKKEINYSVWFKPESLKAILTSLSEADCLAAVKTQNKAGDSACHIATCFNPESLKVILAFFPEDVRQILVQEQNKKGNSVLHLAIEENPESLKVILESLSKAALLMALKEQNKDGHSALHLAAIHNPESLRVLLASLSEDDRLAALKEKNKAGHPALHLASVIQSPKSLKVILESLSEAALLMTLKEQNKDGHSAIHLAIIQNPESLEVILESLPKKALLKTLKEQNKDGHPALHLAAIQNPESLKAIFSALPECDHLSVIDVLIKDNLCKFDTSEDYSNLKKWLPKGCIDTVITRKLKEKATTTWGYTAQQLFRSTEANTAKITAFQHFIKKTCTTQDINELKDDVLINGYAKLKDISIDALLEERKRVEDRPLRV